jgi:hypothetical protein
MRNSSVGESMTQCSWPRVGKVEYRETCLEMDSIDDCPAVCRRQTITLDGVPDKYLAYFSQETIASEILPLHLLIVMGMLPVTSFEVSTSDIW